MEKTRKFAAVSKEIDEEFVQKHEFAISFHLQRIRNCIDDFECAYDYLENLTENSIKDEMKNELWNHVELASTAIWNMAQIFDPTIKGSKTTVENVFKKRRGEQLRALFAITINDKSIFSNFRNRIVHVDEDFDEWYVNCERDDEKKLTVIWRKLSDCASPVSSPSRAIVQWYDYGWGVLHTFNHKFDIRSYKNGVDFISKRFLDVDKYLEKIIPNQTKITFE